MNTTNSPLRIERVQNRDEKRIIIGHLVFLAGKHFIGQRKEVLYTQDFERASVVDGKAEHLVFDGIFLLHNKLLSVDFKYFLSFGPLGDRIYTDVFYDNIQIAKYRFMQSYMGGGSNGKWPTIRNEHWNLIFSLRTYANDDGPRNFSIEYFENLVPDDFAKEEPSPSAKTYLKIAEVPDKILKNKWTLSALKKFRKKSWEVDIRDSKLKLTGKLICHVYQGYQKYVVTEVDGWKTEKKEEFYSHSTKQSDNLFVIEYRKNRRSEFFFPWDPAEIKITKKSLFEK